MKEIRNSLYFEDLIGQIFENNDLKMKSKDYRVKSPSKNYNEIDYIFQKEKSLFLVEVKFYRTVYSQLGMLRRACEQLKSLKTLSEFEAHIPILVVSCIVSDDEKRKLKRDFNVEVIDRNSLRILTEKTPELIEELEQILEDPLAQSETDIEISFIDNKYSRNNLEHTNEQIECNLCQELNDLKAGKDYWREYENLCSKILKNLFGKHLTGWKEQQKTDDKLNRFDLVCRVKSSNSFWNFLAEDLSSRYIILEFKNYEEPIKQGQILTTEKYLLKTALRNVAIICTRAGADNNAKTMTQGAMREHGKLILILDDSLLCKMLEDKQNGNDPSDRLFNLADEFLLSLPR